MALRLINHIKIATNAFADTQARIPFSPKNKIYLAYIILLLFDSSIIYFCLASKKCYFGVIIFYKLYTERTYITFILQIFSI